MRRIALIGAALSLLALMDACTPSDKPIPAAGSAAPAALPPVAERRPHTVEAHGQRRVDDYYWLRDDDREDPAVLAYLEAENAYVDASLAPLADLRETLFRELKGRMRQDDESVPYRDGDWIYQSRYRRELEHPIYLRQRAIGGAAQEVMLDVNELAAGHQYYEIGALAVSEDGRLLAYTDDSVSREEYVVRVRDLESGATLPDEITGNDASVVWANDNETLFYVRREPGTLIPNRVYRHRLGQDPEDDTLVFEETDDRYSVDIGKSRDGRWIVISSNQTLSDEVLLVDANQPASEPRIVLPRAPGHEYSIEPLGESVFIMTNLDAPNFRIIEASLAAPADRSRWRELAPHDDAVLIEDFITFDDYLVVNDRVAGLPGLRVIDRSDGATHRIDSETDASSAVLDINPTTATKVVRYSTSSMATPDAVIDYDMARRQKTVLKVEEVPGGFDASAYHTQMRFASARDGESIPVTLLYRRDFALLQPLPLLQIGYGAYGSSYDPDFNADRFSLVDRGFAVALAHVRGGQERGRRWYDDGRLLNKNNTFTDFIDVTEYLIAQGLADPERIVAVGRSAGGLLMGAIANMRPDLYAAVVAGVPFVDVVTGMLDPSIPLVTGEYDEWGNPEQREFYDYMLRYSPYDQVSAQDYPALLITAGLYDSRVQYWEPAKWAARLRATKTGDAPLYLKTNMEAGHFDASGRFEALKETALEYAFMLDVVGKALDEPAAIGPAALSDQNQ